VTKQEYSLLPAGLFSVLDISQTQRSLMHHWNMKGPCCFLLRSKQPYVIAVGICETAISI